MYAELNRACKPLVAIARFERNLEGAEPLALAKTTRNIYEQLSERGEGHGGKLELVRAALERNAD